MRWGRLVGLWKGQRRARGAGPDTEAVRGGASPALGEKEVRMGAQANTQVINHTLAGSARPLLKPHAGWS